MKLLLSIYQNKFSRIIKYFLLIIFIFILGFKANTEIPEKYKIETSLPNCEGTDYTKWTNCYGEFKFPRNIYKGEWKDGQFHGQGVLKEAWGGIYVGSFKNNLADGFGKQVEKDGSWWECEIKNDLCNGKGKWVYADGSFYEGEFKDSNAHGYGKWIGSDGSSYEGEFKNNVYHGYGKFIDNLGSVSEGYFENYQLNGEGIYTNYNGSVYKGPFKDGFLEGEGFYSKTDGTEATGFFVKDLLNGKGKWKFPSGNIAEGEFKNDQLDGYGTFTWANGDRYEGQFKKGKQHGDGKIIYKNGNKYEGSWEKGLENGFGIFTWPDGEKYEGEYIDGLRNGKGKYTYASGTIYEGDFKENIKEGYGKISYSSGDKYIGEFFKGNEHGKGTFNFKNGDKYSGQFKDGLMHGNGKMVYANGNIYEGLWEDGKEAEGKTTLAKFTTDEKYYALIIGNNDYDKLEDLDNAVNDAKDLEKVLREKYGFETTLLTDKKSGDTLDAIINFTKNRDKQDNILIFYAGHGQLEKKQKRGYWLPTDAGATQDSKWISNLNIKDLIGASDAKHILLIVDSCFSGSLMRGSGENKSVEKLTATSIKRLQVKKTRLVITSGGNEEVADGIGDSKNSVFAEPLIRALKENTNVIRSIELFQTVQNYVINNANQTPEHSLIHGTGHNGGEFLFFPKS